MERIIKEIAKITPIQMRREDDLIKMEFFFSDRECEALRQIRAIRRRDENLAAAWIYTSATALFLCKCLRLCRGFTICSLCMRPIDAWSVDLQEIDFGKRLRFSEAFAKSDRGGLQISANSAQIPLYLWLILLFRPMTRAAQKQRGLSSLEF